MKQILITMVLGFCLISTSAFADANANAGSQSGALSGSQSGAVGIQVNLNPASGSSVGSTGAESGGSSVGDIYTPGASHIEFGDSHVKGSDLSEAVPSVFSAGVTAGGSNPCVVSVGGGASFSGGGFNFARAFNDGECQVRESLRLMVAILPNNNDKGSQMLIRETACQSDIYWQSMERVYINTKDKRFLCTNPRPDNKPIAIRDRAMEKVVQTAVKSPVVGSNYETASNQNGFF